MNSPTPSGPPDGPLHSQGRDDAAQPSHPAHSRKGVLTHGGAALAGLVAGVLIGVTADSGGADSAAPSTTATTTVTSAQTVTATPGADEVSAPAPSSPKPFAFGDTWKLTNIDPAKPFKGSLTVLGYQQGFTSVGKASEEAGEPGVGVCRARHRAPGVRAVPALRPGRAEGMDRAEGVTERPLQSTSCGSRK